MPDYKAGVHGQTHTLYIPSCLSTITLVMLTHQVALVRGMVATILSSRPAIYERPELVEVANNGGSRINQKAQQLLKTLAKSVPGAEDVVAEELAKLGRGKKTPTKKASGGEDGDKCTPSPSAKKKAKLGQPVKMESDHDDDG